MALARLPQRLAAVADDKDAQALPAQLESRLSKACDSDTRAMNGVEGRLESASGCAMQDSVGE